MKIQLKFKLPKFGVPYNQTSSWRITITNGERNKPIHGPIFISWVLWSSNSIRLKDKEEYKQPILAFKRKEKVGHLDVCAWYWSCEIGKI